MKIHKFNVLFFILTCCGFTVFSQSNLTVIEGAAMNMTPLQLVQTQLLGTGLTVSNATLNGSSGPITSVQIGTFVADSTAFTELGLPAGIIMTCGKASYTVGPNNTSGKSWDAGLTGDPDLNIIAGVTTNDACVLEFDFVPQSDTVRFRYVFGSEEFYEFCNQFNDAFGFFLSGPGINGTFSNNSVDIALMPSSANYVTINNLCADPSSNWCNSPGSWTAPFPYINCVLPVGGMVNFQYDGLTYIFTAWHVVTPCSTYHIKLAVADAIDHVLDSGVFLEKNSFSSTGLQINTSYQMPELGFKAIEGCSDALVTFRLSSPPTSPDTIFYSIGGTAINGVDYSTIPDYVIIQPGQDSTWLAIHTFLDNIPEGVENVILNIPIPSCAGSYTYHDTIYIFDNTTLTVNIGNDTTTCVGDNVVLQAITLGGQSPYQYAWNTMSTASSITVNPPAGINYYNIRIQDQCKNIAFDTIIVTTVANPLVTNTILNSTICSGGITNISLQSDVPVATFTWTAFCNSPNTTGFSAGAGSSIGQILNNIGVTQDTVFYTVNAHIVNCTGPPKIFSVIVYPKPNVIFSPPGQTICSSQSITVNLSSGVSGTTFSWTYTAPPTITGAFAGNGLQIFQTLFNSGTAVDTVTYHVTATANGCPGNVYNVKIIVNPLPKPAVSGSSTACAQQQNVSYATPGIIGTNYNWAITNGIITSGGNTSSITVTWGNAGTGSLKVIELFQSTGCSDSAFFNVTINPRPVPFISGPATACELSSQNYSTPNFAGHSYNWSVTGGTIQSGQGTNQISVNWGAAGVATVNVNETILATGCSAQAPILNVILTSFPLAAGQISGPAQVCEATVNNNYSVPVITWATSYNWTYSGTNATITNNGNTISISFAAGATSGTLTVRGVNNCGNGPPSSFAIIIHPQPVMSFLMCNDPVTTTSAQPFKLRGGLPLGGTYAGPGVVAGIFNPSLAGTGNHVITYRYTNTWSCTGSAVQTIPVIPPAPFICGNNFTDPRDSSQYQTVYIGSQCWLSANLNYGSNILSTTVQRDNCVIEKYCYSDLPANCAVSGGLYQWDELMQYNDVSGSQGLCPPGWHVPAENEWTQLFTVYLNNGFAGNSLKYTGFSGFDALLNGVRFENSSWKFNGFAIFFWTSSSHGSMKGWAHGMNSMDPSVSYYPSSRSNAFPVRCIKD